MANSVYKSVEVTGTSSDSIDEAIRTALEKASQTLRNLDWFEVQNIRGVVKDGAVGQFQVSLKIGFRLE